MLIYTYTMNIAYFLLEFKTYCTPVYAPMLPAFCQATPSAIFQTNSCQSHLLSTRALLLHPTCQNQRDSYPLSSPQLRSSLIFGFSHHSSFRSFTRKNLLSPQPAHSNDSTRATNTDAKHSIRYQLQPTCSHHFSFFQVFEKQRQPDKAC